MWTDNVIVHLSKPIVQVGPTYWMANQDFDFIWDFRVDSEE